MALLIVTIFGFIAWSRYESKAITSMKRCETSLEDVSCPKNVGRVFLPRTYPARAIYVGFSNDEVHLKFLESLVETVSALKVKPKVNILIPRTADYEAYDSLRKYFDDNFYSFINLIPTTSKDTVWAQDYLEILLDTNTGVSEILDLPYFGREGEDIPISVGLACQKTVHPQAEFDVENEPANGDYGGNIEPITSEILTVGNNISDETLKVIEGLTTQEIIEVDVNWLETGHVDELVTTLPLKRNAGPCEQRLLVSSPDLAFKIISELPLSLEVPKNPNHPYYDEEFIWADYYHCLHPKYQKISECLELMKANNSYQTLIDRSIDRIQVAMKAKHGCHLEVEKFPQIFQPLKPRKKYGNFDDRAVALNPNSVNNIFFYPNLMLARQEFVPFQQVVDRILKKYSYKLHYVDAKFVHELNGGIHCATNISYGCSP